MTSKGCHPRGGGDQINQIPAFAGMTTEGSMKKAIALLSLSIFIFTAAFAAEGPDAARRQHRQEMKKIKQEMRQKRETSPEAAKAPTKMDLFWQKEGERSGFGNTGERMGNWLKNLNPMPFFKNQDEQYKARKAGQVK